MRPALIMTTRQDKQRSNNNKHFQRKRNANIRKKLHNKVKKSVELSLN